MIGYLNIHSLRNKIDYLTDTCNKSSLDIFCIDETKIDYLFPDSQFHIDGCQLPPLWKNRNQNGGGKILYIKEGITTKQLIDLAGKKSEAICLEITLSKRKWCIVFAYRPPHDNNKHTFLVNCPIL